MHEDAPKEAWKVPAGHIEQEVDVSDEYHPVWQEEQIVAEADAYFPASQVPVVEESPVVEQYVPEGHALQL